MQDVSVAVYGKLLIFILLSFNVPKNSGSPTRVTRLKVPPNMTDPTSMKHSVSNLKVTNKINQTVYYNEKLREMANLTENISLKYELQKLQSIMGGTAGSGSSQVAKIV